MIENMQFEIPTEVQSVADDLVKAGFEAYLVGGCVRDLLLAQMGESRISADRNPSTLLRANADKRGKFSEVNDWDIATNATPEQIQKLFPGSVYENAFGTVLVKLGPRTNADKTQTNAESLSGQRQSALSQRKPAINVVEITTFRLEGKYTDKRHPDEIKFAKTIQEDLARRDFTINAIALMCDTNIRMHANDTNNTNRNLIDPFNGQKDLKAKIIRAVGNPDERFKEDALRLMRAVRFAAQLAPSRAEGAGFAIEDKTAKAIEQNAGLLEYIAKERIRDELTKLLMAEGAVQGIVDMQKFGLLKFVFPELEEGIGVGQNKHHIYTVYEHNLKSFAYAVEQNFSFEVRLASLLHDVGKPRTKRGEGPDSTFYGHQVVGERMALKMLDRLRFGKETVEKVALLVREHMFVYDPEVVTLAGVRRLLRRVGKEHIDDLFLVREADRIGSGVPKAQPYRLRHLKAMVEKVQQDPIHPKMLKIKGDAVMEILKIEPGPRVGKILAILLEEALDDPNVNEPEILKQRVVELGKLTDQELDALAAKAKEKAQKAQERIDGEIKKKYFVQ